MYGDILNQWSLKVCLIFLDNELTNLHDGAQLPSCNCEALRDPLNVN